LRIRTHPLIYEINTWAWLTALSRRYGRPITLESIPTEEYDALADWGFDAIWLMGVWERSPAARDLARRPLVLDEYRRALPDLKADDAVGSPYAIHRYVVDAYLGGPDGLARCRAELARRGLSLLLDYVPNHVAVDHPWLSEHPDAVVHGDERALAVDPVTFFRGPRGDVVAHGRDPYFPAWADTAQINAFAPAARDLAHNTLEKLADQCDGVRCDMAMLLLNRIFANTWRGSVEPTPQNEFWAEIISAIKATHPDFVFMAEAYWDTEAELQALGFDYTYDKGLYDLLREGKLASVRAALSRPPAFQARLAHFVENHDEDRAVLAFGAQRSLTAAAISLLIPGARLLHEGQLAGWRIKAPVQLGRRLEEATDLIVEPFYRALLGELRQPVYHDGAFTSLAEAVTYTGDVLGWYWALESDWRLVVVNYANRQLSVSIALPEGLGLVGPLPVREVLSTNSVVISGARPSDVALDLVLPAFGVQIWRPR